MKVHDAYMSQGRRSVVQSVYSRRIVMYSVLDDRVVRYVNRLQYVDIINHNMWVWREGTTVLQRRQAFSLLYITSIQASVTPASHQCKQSSVDPALGSTARGKRKDLNAGLGTALLSRASHLNQKSQE